MCCGSARVKRGKRGWKVRRGEGERREEREKAELAAARSGQADVSRRQPPLLPLREIADN